MERFRACFADLADPRTGNAQRHDLGDPADRAGGDAVRRRDLRRHGAVRARQGAVAASVPARCRAAFPATTPSRACSACSIPRRSRPASGASWRPSPPGSSGWWRSTARPPGARSTAARPAAAAPGQRLGLRATAGPGPVPGRRRQQRDHGAARAAGAARARRLHRHRRRDALPEGDGAGDPRPRRRLCARAQGQPADAAGRCPPAARRSAAPPDDRAETTDGDHGRIETRRAEIVHDVAWLAEAMPGRGSRRSARSPPRARSTARPPPPPATTCSPAARRRPLRRDRAHALADREPPALGPRRGHGRGPVAQPQGPRPREPRPPAPLRPQPAARQPRPGLDPRQDQARRLGRRLPAQPPPSA